MQNPEYLSTNCVISGSYLTSLCLEFLICKMGVLIIHTSQSPCKKERLTFPKYFQSIQNSAWHVVGIQQHSLSLFQSQRMKSPSPLEVSSCTCACDAIFVISNKSWPHRHLLPLSPVSSSPLVPSPQTLKMYEYGGIREGSTEEAKLKPEAEQEFA